jgi:hypothetical protein
MWQEKIRTGRYGKVRKRNEGFRIIARRVFTDGSAIARALPLGTRL